MILLEIQDTLREPPKAVKSMRKVVHWSLGISAAFYLIISITGAGQRKKAGRLALSWL